MSQQDLQSPAPFWSMRAKNVVAAVGVSKSTLYAWIAQGKFPKPVTLTGGGATARVSTEVADWMKAAVAERDTLASQAA